MSWVMHFVLVETHTSRILVQYELISLGYNYVLINNTNPQDYNHVCKI